MPARLRSSPGVVARAGIAAAIAVLAAACTDDGATAPTALPATTTSTTVLERVNDGVLRIGLLLPESGAGATIGQPLIDAALAAVEVIDAAGGVLGHPIDVVTADEGDSPSTARQGIADLLERDVDAVIGPASSTIALATLDDLLDAGVLACSPTATALALDDFPDRELFIRTAPSDSLQALAIADEAERTGALAAELIYLDDAYGRPLAEATMDALAAMGISVEEPIGFLADDESLLDEANEVIESDAGVIVVIGDAEQGTRMLSSLGEVSGVVSGQDQPQIIVNDAMRRATSPQPIAELAADVRNRIIGVAPSAYSQSTDAPPGPFATNAVDCVNLIALASEQAQSENPEEIAAQIPSVSDGGSTCRLFTECVQLLSAVPNIDYEGTGGQVQIGSDGDPVRYRFDRWGFDDQGRDVPLTNAATTVNRS